MEKVTVHIQKVNYGKNLPLPGYMTEGSAGVDLYAAVDEPRRLISGEHMLVPTGIKIALPAGFEAQIRPRSGLAYKNGITLLNSPGTIDSDYRGEIKAILINLGKKDFLINHGERIAQMVIQRYPAVIFAECEELPSTERNDGGFGHTGQ